MISIDKDRKVIGKQMEDRVRIIDKIKQDTVETNNNIDDMEKRIMVLGDIASKKLSNLGISR